MSEVFDGVRVVVVLTFALFGPGAVIAGLLKVRGVAPWVMVSLAGSLTVDVLVSELAVLLGLWNPQAVLLVLAILCAVAGLAMWQRKEVST